jgi:hypothetical protein
LVDLLDEDGLKQDEWSLTAPTFGKEGQLQVVGWSGHGGGKKFYILRCSRCSQDPELFGEGYFRSGKSALMVDGVPCGCAFNTKWSKEQHSIRCSRKSKELGYTFLGFEGEWMGAFTKLKMLCNTHGLWFSGTIAKLCNRATGCPGCMADETGKRASKPDDVMIASFFASGAFNPETKFWRSDRKSKAGFRNYWYMSCPECETTGESFVGDLQLGCRPCGCSPHQQKEAYVNYILDGDVPLAIKFGVARDSKRRVIKQNRLSIYEVRQFLVYKFPSVQSCKDAERVCKKELETGIIPKQELPDGYTETTYIYNLDKIKQIYMEYGGVEI